MLPSLVCSQHTMATVTNKRYPQKQKQLRVVNTNNASPSNCACPRSHQSLFHFSEKHEVFSLKCIGFYGAV